MGDNKTIDIKLKGTFRCLRCGICCEFPTIIRVSENDMEKVSNHLGIQREEFIDTYLQQKKNKWYMKNGVCPFYDPNEHSCTIQDCKFESCRDYPFVGDKIQICTGVKEVLRGFVAYLVELLEVDKLGVSV